MISETLEPFLYAGMAVLMWGFVASLWVLAYELIMDNTGFGRYYPPDLEDYAIAGLVVTVLCALTFVVLLWTLSRMGV